MKYSVTYPARGKLEVAAPLISTAGSGREHLPIICFRMLHTVEHLPIPVSFPFWCKYILKGKQMNKPTPAGVAAYFRGASFPRRAVSENRNTTEVARCLYMIHSFKTNYQQKWKKKGNIPRQLKGNQVYQSYSWTPITQALGNADF